jgi:hypothetical protein
MGRYVDALEELRRQSGACLLVVHHQPRNGLLPRRRSGPHTTGNALDVDPISLEGQNQYVATMILRVGLRAWLDERDPDRGVIASSRGRCRGRR